MTRSAAASRAPSSGLAAVLVLAQLADLATYHPAHELNVLVTPATALPLKAFLVLLVLAVASIGYRRLLLGAGIVAGALGFASNVVAAAG